MDIRYEHPDRSATLAGQARIQRIMDYNANITRMKDAADVSLADETKQAQEAAAASTADEKYKGLMTSPHVANAMNNLRKLKKGNLVPKASNVTTSGLELESRGITSGEAILGRANRLTTQAAGRTAAAAGESTLGAARSVAARANTIAGNSIGAASREVMRDSARGLANSRAGGTALEAASKVAVKGGSEVGKEVLKGGIKSLGKAAGIAGAGVNIVSAGESLMHDFTDKDGFQLGGSKDANTWTKVGDATGLVSGAADLAGLGLLMAATGPIGLGAAAIFGGIGAVSGIASAIEGGVGAAKQAEKETKEAAEVHQQQIEDIGEKMSVPTRIQKSITAKAVA